MSRHDSCSSAEPPTPKLPLPFASELLQYSNYDINGDGINEINSLSHALALPPAYTPRPAGILVVFVEPRLLKDEPGVGISGATMLKALELYRTDLWEEGYYPLFVAVDVYAGTKHQDGPTLLAMRRFLKKLDNIYPLSGTILFGSFPEAGIVRTTMVKQHELQKVIGGVTFYDVDFLNVASEYVNPRGEIVLADLDGNWEELYHESFKYRSGEMVPAFIKLPGHPIPEWPQANQYLESKYFNTRVSHYNDVFVVDDAQVTMSLDNGVLSSPRATSTNRSRDDRRRSPAAQPHRTARDHS